MFFYSFEESQTSGVHSFSSVCKALQQVFFVDADLLCFLLAFRVSGSGVVAKRYHLPKDGGVCLRQTCQVRHDRLCNGRGLLG